MVISAYRTIGLSMRRKPFKLLRAVAPGLYAELSPDNVVNLDEIGPGFPEKLLWVGECGHSFYATVKNRLRHGSGCPYCAGKKVLAGFNDLAFIRPDVAKDWSSRNSFRPDEVTVGSNKKVWWLCDKYQHEWAAPVVNRTNLNSGCPSCAGKESKGEASLYQFISEQYSGTIVRNSRSIPGISELDIWIPEYSLAFEYNGTYWHSSPEVQRRDAIKSQKCRENGITLVVITDKLWLNNRSAAEELVLKTLKRAPKDSL